MYRTSQKQVTQQISSLENALKLPKGALKLSGAYGYFSLEMRSLNEDGSLSSGIRTIASGMTLGQLSASIAMTLEVIYQANKLNKELAEILAKKV